MKKFLKNLILSNNDYFKSRSALILHHNWRLIEQYLQLKGYGWPEVEVYKKAYDYFSIHPYEFDGATKTEDLYDLFNLDLDAMLHDYHYIVYNVSASFKYTKIADRLFFKETLRKSKSTWNAGFRNFLLQTKTYVFLYPLIAKYIFKRNMTPENKTDFIYNLNTLNKRG